MKKPAPRFATLTNLEGKHILLKVDDIRIVEPNESGAGGSHVIMTSGDERFVKESVEDILTELTS